MDVTPKFETIERIYGAFWLLSKILKKYTTIAALFSTLLKKDAFVWSKLATTAFLELIAAITTMPVLALPDFTKPFILNTDASGTSIGAVMSQIKIPLNISLRS